MLLYRLNLLRRNKTVQINSQSDLPLTIEPSKTYSFKRGETFYVNENINAENITITAHGTGTNPILKGSEEVQSLIWTDEGGGIYSVNPGYEVKWLYIDGQTPKLADHGFVNLDSLPASNQISASTTVDVTGAYAVNRNYKWAHTRGIKVTSQSGDTKTLEFDRSIDDRSWVVIGNAVSVMDGKVNFYGLQSFITNDFDWAYEGTKLYIKLPSPPSNYTIHAVKEDQAFNVTAANCNIQNLEIMHFHRAGIKSNADNLTVENCTIHNIREHAIRVNAVSSNLNINNNIVYDCDLNGIYVEGNQNINVKNNTVYNIGMGVNDAWLKDSYDVSIMIGIGIEVSNSSNFVIGGTEIVDTYEVSDNHIYNILWCGIHTYLWTNGLITRNHVYNCVNKNYEDGGCVYAARQLEPFTAPDTTPFIGTGEISYNIIHDTDYFVSGQRHAIYMDNGSANVDIHNNVCYNIAGGHCFYINEGSKLTGFRDNIFQGDGNDTIRIFADVHTFGPENYGHDGLRNIIVNLDSTKHGYFVTGPGNPFSSGGSSDNNQFFTPYAANRVGYSNRSLASWRGLFGTDANSTVKENWLTFVDQATAREHAKVYTNETDASIDVVIPAGYEDIDGNDISGQTITIPSRLTGRPGYLALKTAN